MKLFELTDNKVEKYGRTLTQIRAVINFKNVKVGDLGGWVEDEKSIRGDCWVYPDGFIFKYARMHGGVMRHGEMWGGEMWGGVMRGGVMRGGVMRGGVMRGGEMWGGVMRGGEMWGGVMWGGVMHGGVMHGGVMRGGEMWGGEMWGGVMHGGVMHGGVMRGGEMWGGEMWGGVMRGGVMRHGEMWGGEMWGGVMRGGVMRGGVMRGGELEKDNHIGFANVGSENGYLFAYIDSCQIMMSRGCFHGTIDEFYNAVNETHGDNEHAEFYNSLRPIIESKLAKFTQ